MNCLDCTKRNTDWFMVNDSLWESYVPEDDKEARWRNNPGLIITEKHFLCIDCLEKRLGRKLRKQDFAQYIFLEINQNIFKKYEIT